MQVQREAQSKKKAEEDKRNQEKQAKKDAEAKVSSVGDSEPSMTVSQRRICDCRVVYQARSSNSATCVLSVSWVVAQHAELTAL